ncbi:MAG: glycosyltransferase [Lacrimispora sp.]|uniref:glycosyltransferase family 32 protein n=1 Tax=Lacrimispora sp. TaxID=2719234 RepID=UPI0039E58D7C
MVNVKNCTVDEFEKLLQEKKVICFGQGKKFQELCERFQIHRFLEFIINNHAMSDTLSVANITIPVKTVDEIQIDGDIRDYIVVISSIQYAREMITQLDTLNTFDGMSCYVPDVFTVEENWDSSKSEFSKIPKIIHYFWFGNNEMPDKFKKNIETWKKFCPEYELKRWDESNYDVTKCSYMQQAYQAKKWGFVPDYARLDILNTYGGIYLDTDVEMIKNWDDLLHHDLFCGFESWNYVAFGLGFGSKKDNPILQEMMEDYKQSTFINEDGSLNLIASPVYQTRILQRHGLILNGKTQVHDRYASFSTEYFAPFNFCGYGKITDNTYSIHQYAATWMEKKDTDIRSVCFDNFTWVDERLSKG